VKDIFYQVVWKCHVIIQNEALRNRSVFDWGKADLLLRGMEFRLVLTIRTGV
jgi:hypothetical protein